MGINPSDVEQMGGLVALLQLVFLLVSALVLSWTK